MIIESDNIRLELSKTENLHKIIRIEQDNSEYIGQNDFNGHKDLIENNNELHLSIFKKSDNELTGYIILAGLKNLNDSIEFRRIALSDKGKGIGKKAVILIKKYCFEHLKAHRIWLDVFEDNKRAIALYKSQGFKTEGLLRDCIKQNGEFRSLKIMSILANDVDKISPKQIDHICLIVKNIKETKIYLETLFDFEIRLQQDCMDILICENRYMHFFIKQMDLPTEFLSEQHISLKVDNTKAITDKLTSNGIGYESGEFRGFKYNNYKWVEWRDDNNIRFECVEDI